MTVTISSPDLDDHHHLSTRSLMTTIISSPDLLRVQLKRWKLRATPGRVSNANRSHSRPSRPCCHIPSRCHCNVIVKPPESSSSWWPCVHVVFVHHSNDKTTKLLLLTSFKTGVSGNILLCMVILRKRLYRQEAFGWWACFFFYIFKLIMNILSE